jgi:hypothetical protein
VELGTIGAIDGECVGGRSSVVTDRGRVGGGGKDGGKSG